jgi:pimeloyl-ACP methyl ester carboxylesterase
MDERAETLPGNPPCVVHHRFAVVNGVCLHYVEALPQPAAVKGKARLCLLLHGFPEFWYSWRHQLPALAAAGFRALAPDLRGYNESDKPGRVADYRLERLADDVAGLIAHAGESDAVVAGHDWGGGIAWYLPLRHPRLVRRLIVLNAPHPAAFLRELRTPAQLARSWYMFFFQLPGLPEWALRAGDFALLERTLRTDPVRPGAFTDEDVRRYKAALARPGALTAAVNYYRAAFLGFGRLRRQVRPVAVPTLLVWGERDRYLGPRLTEGLGPWVPNLRLVRLPDSSHWVQNDAPDEVNRLMLDFLAVHDLHMR